MKKLTPASHRLGFKAYVPESRGRHLPSSVPQQGICVTPAWSKPRPGEVLPTPLAASLLTLAGDQLLCRSASFPDHRDGPWTGSFCSKASSCFCVLSPDPPGSFALHFNSARRSVGLDSLRDHPGARLPNVISLEAGREGFGPGLSEGLKGQRPASPFSKEQSLHEMQNSRQDQASRIPPMGKAQNGSLLYRAAPQSR